MPAPNIAEVNCTKIQFRDGDRVLVRVYRPLDQAQVTALVKSIRRWAGALVEILVVNAAAYDIEIQQRGTFDPAQR